ncbi:MAG TPA: diguanylate cyclase [Terracidiphilus sp.]|nr:diguanylate cyclase [Terracidiphilus sp.]
MNLRQMAGMGGSNSAEKKPAELPNPERVLTLVVEGTAMGVPEIDVEMYKEFRAIVAKLALQLPDRLPEDEKLAQVRAILQEFESYRKHSEAEVRDRTTEWRAAVSFLFRELLHSLGIDATAPNPTALLHKLAITTKAQDTLDLHNRLESFLHPAGAESAPAEASQFRTADHSTENLNASGLRGGGSAIEHVKRLLESGEKAFIVLFRLSCLNMINQRFGPEAVEDCLMAVSAFLTESLHSDDAIYHWSDSSLLAILLGRVNDQILTAELERIAMQNRETTVSIGGRATVLRIPITFDLTPIERLKSAEDLYKITLLTSSGRTR